MITSEYIEVLKQVDKCLKEIDNLERFEGGFIIIDLCKSCGKITISECKHDSCYNNQCSCGYLTGFIGRNHAN